MLVSPELFDPSTLDEDIAAIERGAAAKAISLRFGIHDSDDIIQETFAQLYRARASFDPARRSALRFYARTTAERVGWRLYRSEKQRPRAEDIELDACIDDSADAPFYTTEEQAFREALAAEHRDARDFLRLVRQVARELSPVYRRAFLSRVRGDSTKETARRLGCTEGAARGTLSRMAAKVKDLLCFQ